MSSQTMRGVFPILVTPFDDQGQLDLESFDRLIRFMVELEVDGVTILGPTNLPSEAPAAASEMFASQKRECLWDKSHHRAVSTPDGSPPLPRLRTYRGSDVFR